jgi:hypothetical protein
MWRRLDARMLSTATLISFSARPRLRVLLGLVVWALGCDTSTALTRDPDPPIQTEALVYELRQDALGLGTEISYVFENRTGAPVYVVNCNGAFALRLERWSAGEWAPSWGPFLNQCLSPPIVINAGATLADALHVWGATPGSNTYPQFETSDPSGVYRIVWLAALSSFQNRLPFGPEIPLEFRVSNEFRLELP